MRRTLQVKGVLHLSCGVLLRDEEGVKVPERRLDESVRGHLGEAGTHVSKREGEEESHVPHLEENVPKLLAHLHQRMKCTPVRWRTLGIKVVLLERCRLPGTPATSGPSGLVRRSGSLTRRGARP